MRIIPASDSSLLAVFGRAISSELQSQALRLFHSMQARGDSRIRNLHPGYSSLLVDFDPLMASHAEIAAMIEGLAKAETATEDDSPVEITIPVCYDAEFGLDLEDVAAHNHVSVADVVRLHSSATYYVCFLGFTAGFAYLGGMPESLQTPRLATPRRMIAGGSVGIAGGQTGIYPTETPGGWRLIGRTPLRMFDPQAQPPTLLQAGDRVRFCAIDHAEFESLRQEQR